ncbi:IS21 family transposase [Stieleria magnilauensis]
MATHQSIENLHRSGHSNRKIARLLSIDRGAVNKHVRQIRAESQAQKESGSTGEGIQNRPQAPTGSEADLAPDSVQNRPQAPTGSEALDQDDPATPKPSSSDVEPADSTGSKSQCSEYQKHIETKLGDGLSAVRIHQDLKIEYGFEGSYYSVLRFIRKLAKKTPLPFRRMETEPGQEAQIDFGTAALVIDKVTGKKRRPWMFRIVLSCSRKAYSEVVWRQTTDNFIAAIENSFHYFGGVPKTLVIDNLKAAVQKADWYDPEIHPKLQSFAAHYGTAILPTKPYTPEHKGKVESGVKYVKNNALKGRTFGSLAEQNDHLLHWESTVADTRIHGTTKKQVRGQFIAVDRPALMPLPRDRFAMFHEARRSVSRDGHLEVDKAYYSAPPEYIGRRVWVRWDTRLVRVFNDQWKKIAIHSKAEPGRFRTDSAHIPAEKVTTVERGTDALMRQIAAIGPNSKAWSQLVIASRGVQGVRVLVGLKALAGKYTYDELERACGTAVSHNACRLKTIRNLLKRPAPREQLPLPFIDEHPLIRPLSDYSVDSLNAFRKERNHEHESS